jgi:hypothetical protein
MNGGRGGYKARKTPTVLYPSAPPKLPPDFEVLYHSVKGEVLENTEAEFEDLIVTSQILYKPALLAIARVNFHGNRWSIHWEKDLSRIISLPSKHQYCDWETNIHPDWIPQNLRSDPEENCLFFHDGTYDFSPERFQELQEDFRNHLLSTIVLRVDYNPLFKMDRKLDETAESFHGRCMERARDELNKESQTLEDTLYRLEDRLKQRLERELREIDSEQQEEGQRHDSNRAIGDLKKEMEKLDHLRKSKRHELEEHVSMLAAERETDTLRINQGNLNIVRFALIWLPFTEYVIQEKDARRLLLVRSF